MTVPLGVHMSLEQEIGNFLNLSDIPIDSLVWKSVYGYLPLHLLDTLYTICISDITLKPLDPTSLPVDVEYEDIHSALKHFKLFNIVDDIDQVVQDNIKRNILKPRNVHIDASSYINKFVNRNLRFRKQQLDCDYILTAFDSELFLFKNSVDIDLDVPYTSCTTFRSTSKKQSYVFNEAMARVKLRDLFVAEYARLKQLVYALQVMALKFRAPVIKEDNVDFEL